MGRLSGTLHSVARTIVPRVADIQDGPPLARIVQFGAALFALALVLAFFLGLPTATDTTVPLFIPPIFLLWPRQRWMVATGYLFLALACIARAMSVWFVPSLDLGQKMSGLVVWLFLAHHFGIVCGRGVLARGVR